MTGRRQLDDRTGAQFEPGRGRRGHRDLQGDRELLVMRGQDGAARVGPGDQPAVRRQRAAVAKLDLRRLAQDGARRGVRDPVQRRGEPRPGRSARLRLQRRDQEGTEDPAGQLHLLGGQQLAGGRAGHVPVGVRVQAGPGGGVGGQGLVQRGVLQRGGLPRAGRGQERGQGGDDRQCHRRAAPGRPGQQPAQPLQPPHAAAPVVMPRPPRGCACSPAPAGHRPRRR